MPVTVLTALDRYMTDRALFNTDVDTARDKWGTNFSQPLAIAYGAAKQKLNDVVDAANKRAEERKKAFEKLQGQMDFAIGVAFALMGPLLDKAVGGLKSTMLITESDVDTRVLTKWYARVPDSKLNFDDLLNRAKIRQTLLNHVIEKGLDAAKDQIKPNLSPSKDAAPGAPPAPTGPVAVMNSDPLLNIPEEVFRGDLSPERVQLNMRDLIDQMAIQLKDRYRQIDSSRQTTPAERRLFLTNASKSLLACPPSANITGTIPPDMLANQLFAMIAMNWLARFQPTGGMIWPTVGYDIAMYMNEALRSAGHSIITNNPKLGVNEGVGSGRNLQMVWDGHIAPYTKKKMQEIGRNASIILLAYMEAVALRDANGAR